MKIVGINGSPRKGWNTATLLNKALEGAAQQGAKTELIHLYDFRYQGCISCFTCKRENRHGVCAITDDLSQVLENLRTAAAIIFASPIYLGNITGAMRSFLERFLFCNVTYKTDPVTYYPRRIQTGFIYTMGLPEDFLDKFGYLHSFQSMERLVERLLGTVEMLYSCNTSPFEDYSKYDVNIFDEKKKAEHREKQFPADCLKAFQMGERFAKNAP